MLTKMFTYYSRAQTKNREIWDNIFISNLKSINLKDENVPHVPNVLERPPGKRVEKERLKKQKSKEGSTSNMEDLLNVMMEERIKMNETKIVITKKLGRLVDHE